MGRPIKQKYLNPQAIGYGQGAGAGVVSNASVGGQKIASTSGNITHNSITRGTGYYTANVSATIAAPNLDDGTQATVSTVYLFANGAVKSVGLNNAGSGYTTTHPAITFFGANSGAASATATLANHGITAAIRGNAWFTGTTTGDYNADFIRQRGSKSFVMANATAVHQTIKLQGNIATTGASGDYSVIGPKYAGFLTIGAQFADGSTFAISKITDRVVHSSTGNVYKWSFSTAANVSASNITVKIDSI
jgi:hypothetical protein